MRNFNDDCKYSFHFHRREVTKLRLVKDEREIAYLKKACELADYAVEVAK